MDHPRIDPCGAPIPDREGNIIQREEIQLTQLEVNQQAYIMPVSDHDSTMVRYPQKFGF